MFKSIKRGFCCLFDCRLMSEHYFLWINLFLAVAILGHLVDESIWIYGTLFFMICFLSPLRAILLTSIIFKIIKLLKIFPDVSDTERIALEAGDVWIDKSLFSGHPNINALMKEPYPSLSKEENAFLSGPIEKLCSLCDEWQIYNDRDLPKEAWDFIKKERLFGMIIPKKYGGLGLSALGHSAVIQKISSVSATGAITVMVPNSLGPAELLIHYGSESQKKYYLPRLAKGEEIPCFALTEPTAGSDAGAMLAEGIVFKKNNKIKIRLHFEKRWITLSGISTVLGLAFKCKDPDHLLSDTEDAGITCALIPSSTAGIDVSRRHDPMGIPFINCPVIGKDVEIDIDQVIGEKAGIGEGWKMLMECLSAGRGISLPSLSTGGAKRALMTASSFAVVRQQFGLSIGRFEGIQDVLARIVGYTYLMDAARVWTSAAVDQGYKPGVVSAIVKYWHTELFRDTINDAMDIQGGAGISLGPKNLLGLVYMAAPIGITVEGANILTRNMIIFGQGALRCHPFAYNQIQAAQRNNLWEFDRAFWGHISR